MAPHSEAQTDKESLAKASLIYYSFAGMSAFSGFGLGLVMCGVQSVSHVLGDAASNDTPNRCLLWSQSMGASATMQCLGALALAIIWYFLSYQQRHQLSRTLQVIFVILICFLASSAMSGFAAAKIHLWIADRVQPSGGETTR